MRELSVAEQRYQAVLAVISDGATVTEVAARFGVARKTVHAWLAKYEAGGIDGPRQHTIGSVRPITAAPLPEPYDVPVPESHRTGAPGRLFDHARELRA